MKSIILSYIPFSKLADIQISNVIKYYKRKSMKNCNSGDLVCYVLRAISKIGSILVPFVLAVETCEEKSSSLVCRSGLPLLVVSSIAPTLWAQCLRDRQFLHLLILLNYLQLLLFGILHDCFLLFGERIVVAAKFANESVSCGGAFDE